MDVDVHDIGKIEAGEEGRVCVWIPLTFSLDSAGVTLVHSCQISSVQVSEKIHLPFEAATDLFVRREEQQLTRLRIPVVLRPDGGDMTNTLWIRIVLFDLPSPETIKSARLLIRLTLTFQRGIKIGFELDARTNANGREVSVFGIARRKYRKRVGVNLILLVAPLTLFYYWNNTLNSDVHLSKALLPKQTLDYAVFFVLGFFGLRMVEIFGWFRDLKRITNVLKFPEFYVSRETVEVLGHHLVSLVLLVMTGLLAFTIVLYRSVPVKGLITDPELQLVDARYQPVTAGKVYLRELRKLPPRYLVVRRQSLESRLSHDPIPVGHLGLRGEQSMWTYLDLEPEAEVIDRTFKLVNRNTGDVGVTEVFAISKLSALYESEHFSHILDILDGKQPTSSQSGSVHFTPPDTFVVRRVGHIDYNALAELLNNLPFDDTDMQRAVESAAKLPELLTQQLEERNLAISKETYLSLTRAKLNLFRPRDAWREGMRLLAQVAAMTTFYCQNSQGTVEPSELAFLRELYASQVKKEEMVGGVNRYCVFLYWRSLLKLEDRFGPPATNATHERIAESLGSSGAEFYIEYLKECMNTELLSEDTVRGKALRDYFVRQAQRMISSKQSYSVCVEELSRHRSPTVVAFLAEMNANGSTGAPTRPGAR